MTSEVLQDAIDSCREHKKQGYYSKNKRRIYPFCTENISGYINDFNLKDSSLLTVGSSADQVINAILCDCKDITLYDIVVESKYYCYLKCAGILCLTRQEFLDFFSYRDYIGCLKPNDKVFNKESYDKLKDTLRILDYESFLFFDELFNTFSGEIVRTSLFEFDEYVTSKNIRHNLYLNNDNSYYETKDKIKKAHLKFINKDIFDIDNSIKYDNIWLSNIATWLVKEEKILAMINKVYKSLNEKGKMLASYLYSTRLSFIKGEAPVYNLARMKELLKEYDPIIESFTGVSVWDRTDSAMYIIKK